MQKNDLSQLNLPTHVGIIMDGNRRWAKLHSLPIPSGHSAGASTFEKIAFYSNSIGLKYLTVFAFSTENWKRSKAEVSALMLLFKKQLLRVIEKFKNENIVVKFIGDISKFSFDIQNLVKTIETETANKTGLHLNIAMNYGSRQEIINCTKKIAQDVIENKLNPEDVTEEIFESKLFTREIPDVDLIIRTAGEKRLSNFLLWQSASAEFYYTDILWPAFSEYEFDKAIEEYSTRNRKFGGK